MVGRRGFTTCRGEGMYCLLINNNTYIVLFYVHVCGTCSTGYNNDKFYLFIFDHFDPIFYNLFGLLHISEFFTLHEHSLFFQFSLFCFFKF